MRRDQIWIVAAGLTLVALGLLVGVGAVLPGAVSAQDGSGASARSSDALPGEDAAFARHRMRGEPDEAYLAEALGITAAELREARQAAFEKAVDQAVAEGLITEAQAEMLKKRAGLPLIGRLGRAGWLGGLEGEIDWDALLAESLGITVDRLDEARRQAAEAALQDQVDAGRLSEEEADLIRARRALRSYLRDQGFGDSVRALYEQAIQDAVAAGVITQEQADAILEAPGFGLRGPGVGRRGGPGIRGGMRGGPDGMGAFGLGEEAQGLWLDPSGVAPVPEVAASGDSL